MSAVIRPLRFRPPTARPTSPGERRSTWWTGKTFPGEWWTLFHSQPLNDLIERSLKANPDLKAAQAALMVARENMLAQRGFYYPSVTGGFTATRARTAADLSPVLNANVQNYSLYTPQVSVSYRAGRFRPEPENRGIARKRRNSRRALPWPRRISR